MFNFRGITLLSLELAVLAQPAVMYFLAAHGKRRDRCAWVWVAICLLPFFHFHFLIVALNESLRSWFVSGSSWSEVDAILFPILAPALAVSLIPSVLFGFGVRILRPDGNLATNHQRDVSLTRGTWRSRQFPSEIKPCLPQN